MRLEDYFSQSYAEARARFVRQAQAAGFEHESLALEARGPGGEELSIDVASKGPSDAKRVFLHTSGIHGVEGFAGSAVQLRLLESGPSIPPDLRWILVHSLNPHGMAWGRRVNEHNVDLNRNFLPPGEPYAGSPRLYAELNAFLNPGEVPGLTRYLLHSARLARIHGYRALKESVGSGQYDFPLGVFFGGHGLEEGAARYQAWLPQALPCAERVAVVDLHTGLGPPREDTLLAEASGQLERLRSLFGFRVVAQSGDFSFGYGIRGGHGGLIARLFPGARVDFLTQELGTERPSRVLRALIAENAAHHHQPERLEETRRRLLEVFCPAAVSWRRWAVERGFEVARLAAQALLDGTS